MKNVEIIKVDSKTSKLTITPTRVTIKLSNLLSVDDETKIKNFCVVVVPILRTVENTWRGHFRESGITMHLGTSKSSSGRIFMFNGETYNR